MRFLQPWTPELAIDLGTANTLIHLRGRGIVLREPSVIAIETAGGAVRAIGEEAKRMVGRTPEGLKTVSPLVNGVIADIDAAEQMLTQFMHKLYRRRPFVHPNMLIGVPSNVTEVECRAVHDAARAAGAREAWVMEESLAAAIGAGLMINEVTGNMVVDIGAGATKIAVIALGDVVVSQGVRVAGNEINEAIIAHLRREHNMQIGEQTAEMIKISIGSVWPMHRETECLARGRDLPSGMPAQTTVKSGEIREAIGETVMNIVNAVKKSLEETPPELSADLVEHGIILTGGGALLRGMDHLIKHVTGMPTKIVDDPMSCVVNGIAAILQQGDAVRYSYQQKILGGD